VKGVKYKVEVFGSVLEWTHRVAQTIEEIFVPERGVIFNGAKHLFE
jgi:hypothetical protein